MGVMPGIEVESPRFEATVVGLDRQEALLPGSLGGRGIGQGARRAVLLVDKQDAAQGVAGLEPEGLEDSEHLDRFHDARAVVVGARGDVPGIQVAADQDDLVGLGREFSHALLEGRRAGVRDGGRR